MSDRHSNDKGELPDLSQPLGRLEQIWQWMTGREPEWFDSCLNGHMRPLSASIDAEDANIGYSTFTLTVPRSLCNGGANLHGGAVALIFDMCTSMTVSACARDGFWDGAHVSRTLNCTYLRPAPEGTELLVESEIVSLGKSMAMIKGVIRRKDNGKICYTCEHGKAQVPSIVARKGDAKL